MGLAQDPPDGRRRDAENQFDTFVELYPMLRRFAAVVADADMDPDDLVQDALAATLKRHELTEIHRPGPYLKQAIMHAVTNQRRRAARFRLLSPRLRGDSETADHYPSDLAMLDALTPTDRAVIFLSDVEGLPGAVIAEELGLTHSAVRKRISRSRKQLRRLLSETANGSDGNDESDGFETTNLSAVPEEGS